MLIATVNRRVGAEGSGSATASRQSMTSDGFPHGLAGAKLCRPWPGSIARVHAWEDGAIQGPVPSSQPG